MTIMLNGSDLTVTEVVAAARHSEAVVSYELASSVKGEGVEDRVTMAPLWLAGWGKLVLCRIRRAR